METSNTENSAVRLSKINFPSFSGNHKEWINFYEMQYLVSKLTGSALNICKYLPAMAANYSEVWEALIERYNDPRAQADDYLNQILDFKAIKAWNRVKVPTVLVS